MEQGIVWSQRQQFLYYNVNDLRFHGTMGQGVLGNKTLGESKELEEWYDKIIRRVRESMELEEEYDKNRGTRKRYGVAGIV